MNVPSLARRNIVYQWRGNLSVVLGIALGSAVLTGALLVGDSLRGSLRDLAFARLGWVESLLAPGHFFREQLAGELPAGKAAGVLLLPGSATRDPARSGDIISVKLFGVDDAYWPTPPANDLWASDRPEVALSEAVARDLGLKVGDTLWLNVPKPDAIPRESLLGKRKADDQLDTMQVTVAAILPEGGMSGFALEQSPEPARNVFLPRRFLQDRLGLAGKINVVLLAGASSDTPTSLQLADYGLKLTTPDDRARSFFTFLDPRNKSGELKYPKWQGRVPDDLAPPKKTGLLTLDDVVKYYRQHRPYLLLQSDHLYLDPATEAALKRTSVPFQPSLIYLADRLAAGGAETPYATVAAVPHAPETKTTLDDDGILLVDWPGSPLKGKVGEPVQVEAYVPGPGNALVLQKTTLINRGSAPLAGAADDPDWTPPYPGLTDKLDIGSWENPPFPPYSTKKLMERISKVDEEYWKRYRATPKAYISLAQGQKLWGTRFGKLTSARIEAPAGADAAPEAAAFTKKLLGQLSPGRAGFVIQHVRKLAEEASAGNNDFSLFFFYFSFFLIVAALVLAALLVRLNLERRGPELGLLTATGWSASLLGQLLRLEGWGLIVVGAVLGLFVARGFAWGMLQLLAVKWPGRGTLQFLRLHDSPMTYLVGFIGAEVFSITALWWANRMIRGRSPRQLLGGDWSLTPAGGSRRWWPLALIAVSLAGAGAAIGAGFFITDPMAQAGSFLVGGMLLLTALLTLAGRWLGTAGRSRDPEPTITRLGIRNAGRNPVRSLTTISLLASATFVVVAVEAFHREPAGDFFRNDGGSGGYRLVAETAVPLYQDLGDPKTLAELEVPEEIIAKIQAVESMRVQPGDDASCLNLYKPLEPRRLGVPDSFIRRGGFAFSATLEAVDNPWTLLGKTFADGAFPAIVDANSAQYNLGNVGVGETLEVRDAAGGAAKLRVVGLLRESLFQSEVLVSEASFLKLDPGQQGYSFFLIRCAAEDEEAVRRALARALASQGGRVTPAFNRVELFLEVQNTYLATFQALGGLGLLLGAVGLAIVLVRGVWERRAELALLRALGFQGRQLAAMVLAENVALLILGVGIGLLAALVSIAPHLIGGDAKFVVGRIALLLGSVALVGLSAGALAVAGSLRTPVLTALRRE